MFLCFSDRPSWQCQAAQASRREEGSRPSREAPREGSLDPPPPPHEVSMKSRGSNKERPDTPQEPTSTMMYLDDTVGAGTMSPGPTQKETVTFMVDQQEDFRVWVQQDLPLHPLPMQNSTIHPGAVQWDWENALGMMFVRDSWNQESLSLWSIFAQPLQLASWPRPEQGMQMTAGSGMFCSNWSCWCRKCRWISKYFVWQCVAPRGFASFFHPWKGRSLQMLIISCRSPGMLSGAKDLQDKKKGSPFKWFIVYFLTESQSRSHFSQVLLPERIVVCAWNKGLTPLGSQQKGARRWRLFWGKQNSLSQEVPNLSKALFYGEVLKSWMGRFDLRLFWSWVPYIELGHKK